MEWMMWNALNENETDTLKVIFTIKQQQMCNKNTKKKQKTNFNFIKWIYILKAIHIINNSFHLLLLLAKYSANTQIHT